MKDFRDFLKLLLRWRMTPVVDDDFVGLRIQCDSALNSLINRLESIPEVVCLCGSTRFPEAYAEAQRRLGDEGKIVLSVSRMGHQDGLDMAGPHKRALDDLHKRKIDISDRVLVLNVGGYIGESTRSEIEYAMIRGIPVDYLESLQQIHC